MQADCLSSPGPWEKSCIGYLHLFMNVLLQLYALEAQDYQKNAKKNKKLVEIQFFSLFGGYFSTKWAQLSFFYHILGLLTCLSITLSSPMKKVCQIQFSYSLTCVLQDFVPFRAAALLPLSQFHNHAKQGNGYRWPHIALGRPVFCRDSDWPRRPAWNWWKRNSEIRTGRNPSLPGCWRPIPTSENMRLGVLEPRDLGHGDFLSCISFFYESPGMPRGSLRTPN